MPKEPLGSPVVWLKKFYRGLDEGEAKVPCGTCNACCKDFDEIFLEDDEKEKYEYAVSDDGRATLAREDGHCKYLVDDRCTTYEDRPKNCKQFDCRALAHCGLFPVDFPNVNDAVQHWDVEIKTEEEKVLGLSLRLAAKSSVESGKDPFRAAAEAVFGGYATFARDAVRMVRERNNTKTNVPKIVDQFGQEF